MDARVAVQEDGRAVFTWTISGLTNTNLQLPRPDGAVLIDARDLDGRALTSRNVTKEGEAWVEVGIRSAPATVRFDLTATVDGPFRIFPAQVAANANSPVSVGLTLPAGWSLVGYRENDDAIPDASGTFRLTGPSYVQYLVTDASHLDPGPDARVVGNAVRREGFANLTPAGGTWTLATTYDTDVYGREWDIFVPEGGRVLRASTPFGPLETTPTADGVKVRTPYPVGFGLGGRPFTVEMELPAPDAHGGAFLLTNLSVRAAEDDVVIVDARVQPGVQLAGARIAGGAETTPLRYVGAGPLSVSLAFLPPAAPGHVQFAEGSFVVDAPTSLASAARATAANATQLLPRVAGFAHDPSDTRPFFVAYSTDERLFGWEEGFYSNGLNTISIRASTLANATDGAPHLVPVSVLLHEATHGLLDRQLPDAPHNLSFLHEGLARLAETRAEAYFPGEIVTCTRDADAERCDRHSARPDAETLHARFRAQQRFDAAWGANEVDDGQRSVLYDYSGYVFHAYTLRAPSGALTNALAHIARTPFPGPDATDARAVVDILLANAPGTTQSALLEPGGEAAALGIDEFRFCLGTLAAPGYPWEVTSTRAPPGGCPASGYGASDADLPPPPTPAPTMSAPTDPMTSAPTRVLPKPPTTSGEAEAPLPPRDEAPGAVVEDAPMGGAQAPGTTDVPAAPVGALFLAVAGVALLARARRAH